MIYTGPTGEQVRVMLVDQDVVGADTVTVSVVSRASNAYAYGEEITTPVSRLSTDDERA